MVYIKLPILLFLLIWGGSKNLWGQTTFNKRYDIQPSESALTAIEVGNEIVVLGYKGYPYRNDFIKLDAAGNFLFTKIYEVPNYEISMGYKPVRLSSGGYVGGGFIRHQQPGSNATILLTRFNDNGDTLYTKKYQYLQNDGAFNVIEAKDGGFLLTGWVQDTLFFADADVFLLKTDSLGNEEWVQFYGFSGLELGGAIENDLDGGYVISALRNYPGDVARHYIIKTDSLGNQLWYKLNGTFEYNSFCRITVLQDSSGYILSGSMDYNDGNLHQYYVAKMDRQGNIIWEKSFGEPILGEGFVAPAIELPDHSLILLGQQDSYRGRLVKTSSSGDTLWTRHLEGPPNFIMASQVSSVFLCADKGFLISGASYGPNNWDVWVMKLDSNGCLNPGCGGLLAIDSPPETNADQLTLYPYPDAQHLSIKTSLQFPIEVELFDLNGRRIEKARFESEQSHLDLSALSKGVYILHFKDANGTVQARRWQY